MLGNRAVWRHMFAISTARSDVFIDFSYLEGGCLLASEAPAAFFWALYLVLAIGAEAFSVWCRGGQEDLRCATKGEDEVLSGSASRSLCLGRSNDYSSLEP